MRLVTTMILCAVLQAGCGDNPDDHGDAIAGPGDLSVPVGEGDSCVGDSDCGSPQLLCAYPIADGCAAKGHCARVATPTCASVIELCGCNGKTVISGPCFYQPGFASGATTGAKSCSDGGI